MSSFDERFHPRQIPPRSNRFLFMTFLRHLIILIESNSFLFSYAAIQMPRETKPLQLERAQRPDAPVRMRRDQTRVQADLSLRQAKSRSAHISDSPALTRALCNPRQRLRKSPHAGCSVISIASRSAASAGVTPLNTGCTARNHRAACGRVKAAPLIRTGAEGHGLWSSTLPERSAEMRPNMPGASFAKKDSATRNGIWGGIPRCFA